MEVKRNKCNGEILKAGRLGEERRGSLSVMSAARMPGRMAAPLKDGGEVQVAENMWMSSWWSLFRL